MKVNMNDIGDRELLAYVDGQLDPAARETVERYLAQNPGKAAEVDAYRRQNEAIGTLFGHIGSEPVPERLDPHRIAGTRHPASSRGPVWRMAAAALVLLAFGTALGWYGRDVLVPQSRSDTIISAAVNAHRIFTGQRLHPVEVAAEQREHLSTWLSGSLDRRLVVPASLPDGFELVGGRLLPADTGTAAQLMYEAGGRRVTLYLTPRTAAEPGYDKLAAVDGLDALYWANDALTCTIVGDLTRAEMETIASEVFRALSWQDSGYRGI